MKPEFLVCVIVMLSVAPAAFVTQAIRLREYLPRARDRSLPPLDRIEAQNRVFGAIVGLGLTAVGIVAVIYLFTAHLVGG